MICETHVGLAVGISVGILYVHLHGDGGGDSSGGSWVPLVVGRGVSEEEDQMTAWRAEPATEIEGIL